MRCVFCKVLNYEYWPACIWHLLALPIHIYNSIKCKSVVYFTALNPSFGNTGGFIGDFKSQIQNYIPQTYTLKEKIVLDFEDYLKVKQRLNLTYPVVLKPDAGERGKDVEIIYSDDQARKYLSVQRKYRTLLQEFANFKAEYGIFVYNHPHTGWQISGINTKKPFVVLGDGIKSLLELIKENCRYRQQLDRIIQKGDIDLTIVPNKGQYVQVENILNHRYGTEFVNCTELMNDRFKSVIIGICSQIPGFDYGRFDLKANSFEDIELHKFKIIELNGAAAEPTIIYDQDNTGFFNSLKIVINHLRVQGKIAQKNINQGHKPVTLRNFSKAVQGHFFS
jgi:hypothetical protein